MKRKFLLLLLVAIATLGHVSAQNTAMASVRDSVVYETTFYFQLGVGRWIQQSDYGKMSRLLRWAQSDTTTLIEITGWADKTGILERNEKISLRRAIAIRNYLLRKGISSERISFEGRGVDAQSDSDDKARRADVRGIARLTVENKPQTEPVEITPTVPPVVVEQPKQEVAVVEQPKQEVAVVEQPKTVVESTHIKKTVRNNHRWYAGIEGGVSLGVSTFSSFTPKGGVGWNVGILGGYRISPLLSAEVGISLSELKLGASNCCSDYFLGADGMRYLSHVAGMDSYSYREIHSSVSMQQYALRLNVDLLQIVNANWDKHWSLTISPAIYGINSTATLKTSNATIIKHSSQFQFGAGAGIGVSYHIHRNLGVGLRSGAAWVFGKRFDGITTTDHKENLIWNNTMSLTWRF